MSKEYFYNRLLFDVIKPYIAGMSVATNNPYVSHDVFIDSPDDALDYDVFVGVPTIHRTKSAMIFNNKDSMRFFKECYKSKKPFALLLNTSFLAYIYYNLDRRKKPFCIFFNEPIETALTSNAFVWYTDGVRKSGYCVVDVNDWRKMYDKKSSD